jgi:hypothetical protein
VIAVPELRGDEYLFTPHQSRGECTLRCGSDLHLIAIHRGGIHMPISGLQRPGHCIFNGAAAARLVDAKSEAWDRDAVVEDEKYVIAIGVWRYF